MTFNERIKSVIEDSGLNKTRFADRLNISQAYLSQLCSGVRSPSDRTITDICREFHVNEAWLRTGVGEMHQETTEQEKLAAFFGEVLATAPDERSAFVAALADLPPEFWPLVAELARNYAANYKKD